MDATIKIYNISASYKPAYVYGGPTMSISKLCEQIQRFSTDISVNVLTTTANGETELPVEPGNAITVDGITVTYFKRLTKDHTHFSPALLFALYKRLTRPSDKCLVHIHAWWNLISLIACFIAILKNIPVLLTPRGTLSIYSFNNRTMFGKKLFHLLIGRVILKKCHFHVTSEKEKGDIQRLLNPKSITVIPNFVQLPVKDFNKVQNCSFNALKNRYNKQTSNLSHEQVFSSADKPLRLLFLSRIEEKKGLDLLFRALPFLNIPWSLSVAGNGKPDYVQKLKSLANHLQLNSQLSWLGHLNNKEKFTILQSHDLLVLPSYDENFANVVIESVAMGTPVLISNTVGLADYISKHKFGIICRPDPHSIKDSIHNFFKQRDLFDNQHFQRQIKQDFDELNLAQQYIKLYKSLV